MTTVQTLEWQIDAGADECIGDTPVDRRQSTSSPLAGEAGGGASLRASAENISPPPQPSPARGEGVKKPTLTATPSEAIAASRAAADSAKTLDELFDAIRTFDGCGLKKTATNTVIFDGNLAAPIMVIGEAPGAQEDMQGIPFCGPSGKLLDKTFLSIGLTRAEHLLISNTVYWRPPGNRAPSTEELAICEPFVQKLIALVNPKLLLLAGGVSVNAILQQNQPLSRLRGKFYDYANPYLTAPIPTGALYHPSYLMRSPGQKRLAWYDMLLVRQFIDDNKLL